MPPAAACAPLPPLFSSRPKHAHHTKPHRHASRARRLRLGLPDFAPLPDAAPSSLPELPPGPSRCRTDSRPRERSCPGPSQRCATRDHVAAGASAPERAASRLLIWTLDVGLQPNAARLQDAPQSPRPHLLCRALGCRMMQSRVSQPPMSHLSVPPVVYPQVVHPHPCSWLAPLPLSRATAPTSGH